MIVLIAPLDWGLGHATRCIPLIRALERAGHTVIPCAGGAGLRLLRAEFPHLTFEDVPGYAMRYTRRRALLPLWMLAQLPLFLLGVLREGVAARRLVRKHGAGLVIADGRYGFRAPGIPAVFVTHQLDIIPPGPARLRGLLAPVLRRLNARALRGFAEVWVPDFPGAVNLSGALGHPEASSFSGSSGQVAPRIEYIGPLCRFGTKEGTIEGIEKGAEKSLRNRPRRQDAAPGIDILALVSGPEPQRSLFETAMRTALAALPGTRVLVRGLPGLSGTQAEQGPEDAEEHAPIRTGALNIFDHLPGARLSELLSGAESVVCRSGYTTMMELAGLGKSNVLLVPTPGQPEQEYLAVHARARGFAAWQDQDALDVEGVEGGLRAASALPGFSLLSRAVEGAVEESGERVFTLTTWIGEHPLMR